MVGNVSVLQICNLALLSIGSRSQISSLNENSTQSNACNTYYSFIYNILARTAWWNCFRKQATLSLLAAAQGTPENVNGTTLPLPPSPWLYSYAEPSDCLKARMIVPTLPPQGDGQALTTFNNAAPTWLPNQGQIPFAVAYSTDSNGNPINVILTNQSQAQLMYCVNQPNPIGWDSMFTQAMVASLAAYLVPALSLNLPLMQMQIKNAEVIIMNARTADANEGSNSQNREADWIRARNGSGTWMNGCYGYGSLYDDMSWPVIG